LHVKFYDLGCGKVWAVEKENYFLLSLSESP